MKNIAQSDCRFNIMAFFLISWAVFSKMAQKEQTNVVNIKPILNQFFVRRFHNSIDQIYAEFQTI